MAWNVAVFVGSLRRESFNRKMAKVLVGLAPEPLHLEIVEIGQLPLYSQDYDDDGSPPAEYTALRQRIKAADALLFVTPEHNRSVPAGAEERIGCRVAPARPERLGWQAGRGSDRSDTMGMPSPEAASAARDLLARFNDAINRRDLQQFRGLWTADAVWDIRTMSVSSGPEAITATIAAMLETWEVFFQLTGEAVIETDGELLVARSPMWEFGRSHAGQSYSGDALNVDRIVQGSGG